MASDTIYLLLTAALKTSTTTDRTVTATQSTAITESFWAEVKLPAAAADTVLKLNLLTSPKALVVIGDTGVSFKLDSTGTDDIQADPVAVVCDQEGLGIDEILLSNSDTAEHTVTVIAGE